MLHDGVNTLAYFHKDCNKKDCNDEKPVIIEKDYHNEKIFVIIKKLILIEKI